MAMATHREKLFVIILTLMILLVLGGSLTSYAQNEDSSLQFAPESRPYGMTFGEQTGEWWNWFLSIPTDRSPINDQTGERCAEGQKGPVWFLVGSGGGKAERSCTIPAGVAILIPAINVECSTAEDESLQSEDDLRMCANSDQDLVTRTAATLDGIELQVHRVDSPLFEIDFPPDNIFGAREGPSPAVSDGFWVFLKPLTPGTHELHVEGLLVDPTVTGPVNLVEDSTYHLTVEPLSSNIYSQSVVVAENSFDFPVNSTSNVSEIRFDEGSKQLSFKISGGVAGGITSMPISWLLEGPYTLMINGSQENEFETSGNSETGETGLTIFHSNNTYDITVSGTRVVPEFQYAVMILIVMVSAAIILVRIRFANVRGLDGKSF